MNLAQENAAGIENERAFFFGDRIRGALSERGAARYFVGFLRRSSATVSVRERPRKNASDFPNGSDFGSASDFCGRLPKEGRVWNCLANLVPTSETRRFSEVPPIFRGHFRNEVGSEFAPHFSERLPKAGPLWSLPLVYAPIFLSRAISELARRIRRANPKAPSR
jgi:hypothetical protein